MSNTLDIPNLESLDFGKKKKKKSTSTEKDGPSSVTEGIASAVPGSAGLDLSTISAQISSLSLELGPKKKKKEKKTEVSSSETAGDESVSPSSVLTTSDGSKSESPSVHSVSEKKSVESRKVDDDDDEVDGTDDYFSSSTEHGPTEVGEGEFDDPIMGGLYRYSELLDRVFGIMREKNKDGSAKKKSLKQPSVVKDGAKKTAFLNFLEVCKSMNRDPEHTLAYLLGELGTTGNFDGNSSLIIRGKFQQKSVTAILRRYINEYVLCHMCKSLDTILAREPTTRLYQLQCESCGATRSVASINKAYMAVIRRKKK